MNQTGLVPTTRPKPCRRQSSFPTTSQVPTYVQHCPAAGTSVGSAHGHASRRVRKKHARCVHVVHVTAILSKIWAALPAHHARVSFGNVFERFTFLLSFCDKVGQNEKSVSTRLKMCCSDDHSAAKPNIFCRGRPLRQPLP